jgi:hypothetical protein
VYAVVPEDPALSGRAQELVHDVRGLDVPFPVQVGGETAGFIDQQTSLGDSLPLALAIVATTTLVILFAMTGSVVLPVKALVMNLLTLCAAFGILVFVFQHGRLEGLLGYTGQGGLDSTQPILLFVIAFALSTDYGVFLLTRIKEARDGGAGERESVAIGLQRTGRIVTAAALLFCVAIGAFAMSRIVFIKEVGVGTALAVLIDATLVRALLVPSLMALLGRWNWWAPAPLRKLHEHLGLREGGPGGRVARPCACASATSGWAPTSVTAARCCRPRSRRCPRAAYVCSPAPRSTRPSPSARCPTSATSSTRACAWRPSSGRRSCSTPARRSSVSWAASPAARATARARSTSTCCCSATSSTSQSACDCHTRRSRAAASCSSRCSSSIPS